MAVQFSSTNSAPATPKRRRMSPGSDANEWGLTWGWTTPATPGDNSLQDDDLFQSPGACSGRGGNFNSAENKRGRPRADMITGLIEEGAVSPSAIKCKFCSRVFPREKSLQAHLRTHTGERPYECDYPGCTRAFTQSGQLKTHQRLHTGEKPFRCSELNCPSRFTHANRHCPDHPNALLRRSNDFVLQPVANTEEPTEVRKWLEKYLQRQQEETPPISKKASPRPAAPPASPKKQSKARKGLMSEVEQQENTTPSDGSKAAPTINPLSAEKPKRRWLREAGLEGVLQATASEAGLARPIKWSETEESSPVQAANLMRPSVLMLASPRAPEEEWLGAMALVALANNQKVNMQNQPLDLAAPNYTNL